MKKNETMNSLASKTEAAFDKAFIVAMTAHHNEAIAMAKIAEKKSKRKEILKLAKNIITAQSKENAQMKVWKSEWK